MLSFIISIALMLLIRMIFWIADILQQGENKVGAFIVSLTGFFILNWLVESTFQFYNWFQ